MTDPTRRPQAPGRDGPAAPGRPRSTSSPRSGRCSRRRSGPWRSVAAARRSRSRWSCWRSCSAWCGRGTGCPTAARRATHGPAVRPPRPVRPSPVPASRRSGATPAGPTPTPAPGSVEAAAQVCAYPQGWRSATLQNYAGRRALVWTAVDAVSATGPLDPSIPFEGVAGDTFTAIGWCAPVDGPDRPPDGTTARLFRVADGRATPEPYVRLHPAAPNPLGELWGPVGSPAASPGPGATPAASPAVSPATRGIAGPRGWAAAGTVARRGRDGADVGARALPDRARGARRRLRPRGWGSTSA